ncbi:hypothetical protein [Thermomonas sp.]|uniref:hypothetical protein n=1 Tax=Thermomonas sp. TaxID=1971895 RepID=UPI00248A075A|nr:hypothetical protein [Thermomonas sp.]MDI1253983.1 hypothetical protein [Thermomonas sp.]
MNEEQMKAKFESMLDDAYAKGEAVYKTMYEERMVVADQRMAELAAYDFIFRTLTDNASVDAIRSALVVIDLTLENAPMTLSDTQRDAFQAQAGNLRSAMYQRLGEPEPRK